MDSSSSSSSGPPDDFDPATLDRDREMRRRLRRRHRLPLVVKRVAIAATLIIGVAVAVNLGYLGQTDLSGSPPEASHESSTGMPRQEASAQRPAEQASNTAGPARDAPTIRSAGQATEPPDDKPEANQPPVAAAAPESASSRLDAPAEPATKSEPRVAPILQAHPQLEPAPALGAPPASFSSEPRSLPPDEVAVLVQRARDRIRQGNIAAARRLLERAAEGEHGEALFALAETYDPGKLAEWGVIGTLPNITKAKDLYEKAAARGISPAKERLLTLR